MMAVLRELGIYRIDYQQHPGGDRQLSMARRLSKELSLSFREVEVEWPHGDFFEAEAISWLEQSEAEAGVSSRAGGLLLSSAFSNYLVAGDDGPLKLEELPDFTPGLVAINGPGGVRFLAATSSEAKLLLWPAHEASSKCSLGTGSKATALGLAGREPLPWRCMAGTLQPCEQAANQSYWCLLLAGWDGSRTLVAEMRMEDVCSLPDGPIRPSYSVPLEADTAAGTRRCCDAWNRVIHTLGTTATLPE